MLHHDNSPAQASLLICEILDENETTVAPQPPYSPDIAPADFLLFSKLKSTLNVLRFESVDWIEENSLTEPRAIKKKSFQDYFQTEKNAGRIILKVEGSTLKVTRPTRFSISGIKFYLKCLGTF
jgi:hypothetical protein